MHFEWGAYRQLYGISQYSLIYSYKMKNCRGDNYWGLLTVTIVLAPFVARLLVAIANGFQRFLVPFHLRQSSINEGSTFESGRILLTTKGLQLFSSCNLLQAMVWLFSQPAAQKIRIGRLLERPTAGDENESEHFCPLLLECPFAQKIYNCKGPSISSHHYLFKYDIGSHSKTKDIISNSHRAIVVRFSSSILQVR